MPIITHNKIQPAPLHGFRLRNTNNRNKDLKYIDLPIAASNLAKNIRCLVVIATGVNRSNIPYVFTGARINYNLIKTKLAREEILRQFASFLGVEQSPENIIVVSKPPEIEVHEIDFVEDRAAIAIPEDVVKKEVELYASTIKRLNRNAWLQATLGKDGFFFIGASWTMEKPNGFYKCVEDFSRRAVDRIVLT